jgi:hypothetical protein
MRSDVLNVEGGFLWQPGSELVESGAKTEVRVSGNFLSDPIYGDDQASLDIKALRRQPGLSVLGGPVVITVRDVQGLSLIGYHYRHGTLILDVLLKLNGPAQRHPHKSGWFCSAAQIAELTWSSQKKPRTKRTYSVTFTPQDELEANVNRLNQLRRQAESLITFRD